MMLFENKWVSSSGLRWCKGTDGLGGSMFVPGLRLVDFGGASLMEGEEGCNFRGCAVEMMGCTMILLCRWTEEKG